MWRVGAQPERISADSLELVPNPRQVAAFAATYALPNRVTIHARSADERNVAGLAQDFLTTRGISAVISPSGSAQIRFATVARAAIAREAYRLHVGPSGVDITASSGAGLFYGLQTFEQLFPDGVTNAVHHVAINDGPSYGYRGMHLDVGRHFFPIAFVRKYIDLIARYKLNVFHWHLTEDQGWRIEIKRYPKLTQISSCRSGTQIGDDDRSSDGIRYCGFYTQAQIRDVVAYAKRRYVTIIPEIEMPGHSVEVLAAYPELACKPGHYSVRVAWGISDDIVCPSERTVTFYENVLSEVVALFPGPYIHTGGDEAPKAVWKSSPLVAALERRYHLNGEDAVQGWFDRRIERFLNAHGKRMIGWDEILGASVSRSTVVMSWRGIAGGVVAATSGNDVIMTPTTNLYFDYAQGNSDLEPINIGNRLTLEDVYDYDPGIDVLTPAQAHHILGAQGNLWTEFVATPEKAEYMLLPRMMALAELTWTPVERKDYDNFVSRTPNQYARLERENIHFRIPDPIGLSDTVTDKDSVTIHLRSPAPHAALYYTVDGSQPTATSQRYTTPLVVPLEPGRAVIVRVVTILASGRVSVPAQAVYQRKGAAITP